MCRGCNGQGTQWREGEAQPCEACNGSGYDTKESVEWYIAEPIRDELAGSDAVFNAAGHEDEDELVLGSGRPFVVEIKEPHRRPADVAVLADAIAGASQEVVTVDGLAPADRGIVERLTQTTVRQTYRLTVKFSSPIAADDFVDAVTALDSVSVRQRIDRDDRITEQIRTPAGVRGKLQSETRAAVDVISTDGLDLEALMVGGAERSDPNLADLLGTAVTVESIAIVAVEGAEELLGPSESSGA